MTIYIKGSYYSKPYRSGIYINDHYLGEFNLQEREAITVDKKHLNNNDLLLITLEHKGVKSPFELKKSPDTRKLKFQINSIEIVDQK